MRYAPLLIVAVVFAVVASAEEYKKGPNGGLTLDVAGVDAEVMTAGNTVTINVFVPNTAKPVPTNRFTAAAPIVSGSNRETISLTPQGENSLKGDAKNPITPDATITLTIKTAEEKSGQVKFKK
jgi:hypothetical protein